MIYLVRAQRSQTRDAASEHSSAAARFRALLQRELFVVGVADPKWDRGGPFHGRAVS